MLRLTSLKRREGEEVGEREDDEDSDKSPGAVPALQPEYVEGVQLLQAGKWLSCAIPGKKGKWEWV